MSRQITEQIVKAFMNDTALRVSNSEVHTDFRNTRLYLFNNLIAKKDKATGKIRINMAGYPTVTTRERLNGIPNCKIYQRNGKQFLNGVEIDTNTWYAIN